MTMKNKVLLHLLSMWFGEMKPYKYNNYYLEFCLVICLLPVDFSPLQDDFIVLHIPGEYDSVLETVFKTEFLTLLSSKYQDSMNRQLKVDINNRYL